MALSLLPLLLISPVVLWILLKDESKEVHALKVSDLSEQKIMLAVEGAIEEHDKEEYHACPHEPKCSSRTECELNIKIGKAIKNAEFEGDLRLNKQDSLFASMLAVQRRPKMLSAPKNLGLEFQKKYRK